MHVFMGQVYGKDDKRLVIMVLTMGALWMAR